MTVAIRPRSQRDYKQPKKKSEFRRPFQGIRDNPAKNWTSGSPNTNLYFSEFDNVHSIHRFWADIQRTSV